MMTQGAHRTNAVAQQGHAPPGSHIAARVAGAHFWDAWAVALDTDTTTPPPVLDLYLATARRTPAWVDACMTLRNRAVRWVGLKDLGRLSDLPTAKRAADYRVGERVGIFTLIGQTPDEVLLGDSDRHLDVVVSLHRQAHADGRSATLTVTTVVHLKNRLGRLYMLPVRPMHRLIVKSMATALARAGHG